MIILFKNLFSVRILSDYNTQHFQRKAATNLNKCKFYLKHIKKTKKAISSANNITANKSIRITFSNFGFHFLGKHYVLNY